MDLVAFDEQRFESIQKDFLALAKKVGFGGQEIKFIPVAAREGDNIVFASVNMPWYSKETLLEVLENCSVVNDTHPTPARFPVQYVIRPHSEAFPDFRGYAGRLESGYFQKGEEVVVLPTLKKTRIKNIYQFQREKEKASAKESVLLTLEDEVDISRGNMIVKESDPLRQKELFAATICWMEETTAIPGKMFWLQHGPNRVKAKIISVEAILDIQRLEATQKKSFDLNDIGDVTIQLAKPIFADSYNENPANGSFILIDEFSNNTVAVGFIR